MEVTSLLKVHYNSECVSNSVLCYYDSKHMHITNTKEEYISEMKIKLVM